MAQFGSLTGSEQTDFLAEQAGRNRVPTLMVWLDGVGDISEYVISCDTDVAIESAYGRGHIGIGVAFIVVSNEGGTFHTGGVDQVDEKAAIWVFGGFSGLNVPIFTGYVRRSRLIVERNLVSLTCMDNMGLLLEKMVGGFIEDGGTPRLVMEALCKEIGAQSNVPSTGETDLDYDFPVFDWRSGKSVLEEVCDGMFYVAYYDEQGVLQAHEREYSNDADWTFDDTNTDVCQVLPESVVINSFMLEYDVNFYAQYADDESMEAYGQRKRIRRALVLNSDLVSQRTEGGTDETLDNDFEGFKIASSSAASIIDCIHVALKGSSLSGQIYVSVYTDSGGDPNTLLGTSQVVWGSSIAEDYMWAIFYFTSPIKIDPSTAYWIIIDSSRATGTLTANISTGAVVGQHTYYSAGWNAEDNKRILHRIRGSVPAQRVCEDLVRFYKEPKDRTRIVAPAVPHLQLMDRVLVDTEHRDAQVLGKYVIQGRRHMFESAQDVKKYTTIDVLRRV